MSISSMLGWGLSAGVMAPDFSLMAADNKLYTLSQFRGRKVFLYFYPQAFTPGCTKQACSFRNEYDHVKELGYTLLGVSTDEISVLQNFVQKHRLPFPMLSDATKRVCGDYQVLLPLLGKANRVTFLIDEQGRIENVFRFLKWDTYAKSLLEKNSVPSTP